MNSFFFFGPYLYVRMTAARTTTTAVVAKMMFGSIIQFLPFPIRFVTNRLVEEFDERFYKRFSEARATPWN